MAYVSGFDGGLTFTGTSGVTLFSPATTDLKVEGWSIRQSTDEFGARALGDSWETGFVTASEWTATAVFLVESTLEVAGHSGEIRVAASSAKTFAGTFLTTTGESYTGSGYVTNMSIDVTPDGPARMTAELMGDGKLEFAGPTP